MKIRRQNCRRNEAGQSTVEYILVMSVVVIMVITVLSFFKKNQYFYKNVASPLVSYLRYNYKYADPQAQGWDESAGSPRRHIQISRPNDSETFRLFSGGQDQ